MPIHDLGYRSWKGELYPEALRWWVIGRNGIRLAWKSRWLRRSMFYAWVPFLVVAGVIYGYEQLIVRAGGIPGADTLLIQILPGDVGNQDPTEIEDQVVRALREESPARMRHTVWSALLFFFFRYPQGALMVLLIGQIAPSLISRDVRSQAFLLYFSRPLGRLEYILGKFAVLWGYLLAITAVPALALYVFAVLLSPQLTVAVATWDLPLRILIGSAALIIPTAALALAFSAMTTESRYAGFAWFAVWLLGGVAYVLLNYSGVFGFADGTPRYTQLSLYHTLGDVQNWVFGLGKDLGQVMPSLVLLVAITVVSLMILFRRVSAPMQI